MSITFTGHQLDVTPALRDFTTEKFDRLHRHFDRMITSIDVIFSVENKLTNKAEATIHVPGEKLHASCEDTSMYSAVDKLVDVLNRQLTKHKEKTDKHRS